MDLERIDINQCPIGEGNPGPNKYAGTARCKEQSTEVRFLISLLQFQQKKTFFCFCFQCEPIHGYGLRRGGYQCRCRPGYRLPFVDRRPFLGEIIERSSEEQYKNFFDCERIGCKLETQFVIRL